MLRTIIKRNKPFSRLFSLRSFATASSSEFARPIERYAPTDNKVRIVEVGPRDGLQNEKKIIPLATKLELIKKLAQTGLRDIEAGSFVAPKWVPQMADSSEILESILNKNPPSDHSIRYSFLAPNAKGLNNGLSILRKHPSSFITGEVLESLHVEKGQLSSPVEKKASIEMSVFAAATESFSQKNLNCSIDTSMERFEEVIKGAKDEGLKVRAYISVVLGCPFEGYDVDPRRVADIAVKFLEMGADEIDLGDTTGMGTAPRTLELLRAMQAAGVRSEDLAMHFHDTYGQALVNTVVCLEHGIRSFDSSVGGLGGCPYSPGATGNVATEDMVYLLRSMGMETGINLDALADIGDWITREIGKPNASSVGKALIGSRQRV